MTKEELIRIIEEYGDAVVTYRSENSNKLKYNVCTTDFNNAYIQSRPNRAKEGADSLLMFCWDCDAYRLIKPSKVKRVDPLSSILRNE